MKKFSLMGMIVSLIVCLFGIISFLSYQKDYPGDMYYGSTYSDYSAEDYKHGFASFGADFYSFVNNNSAIAAEASMATSSGVSSVAKNQRVLSKQIQATSNSITKVCGSILISIGLLSFCGFGMVYSNCNMLEAEEDVSE